MNVLSQFMVSSDWQSLYVLKMVQFLNGPDSWMTMTSLEGNGSWRQWFVSRDLVIRVMARYLDDSSVYQVVGYMG